MFYAVIATAASSVFGTSWLKANIQPKPNKYKQDIQKTISTLKAQAEELNNPATFAAYSKLNRNIQKMEKDCSDMPDFESSSDLSWVLSFMPYFFALLFIGQYTAFTISGDYSFWPINFLLGYQDQKTFNLSLVSWYMIVLSIIKRYTNYLGFYEF